MIKKQEVINKLKQNQHKLNAFQVKELYLFGSVARNEAGPDSDVDFIVDFEPGAEVGFFKFVRLQKMLSELLDCSVDLTTRDALHQELKNHILKESLRAA
ncbi:MAG: nucleotidyltransferase family protein [Desulfobacteraceae bacterium]|jgi:predicted nucleotidyltransferase|nr:nucleotidyltransferase family protein [Desulfobacteraceae bacterium]